MKGLLVAGAGGHGKVVADTASETGRWDAIAFIDDRFESLRKMIKYPVLGKLDDAPGFLGEYKDLVVAIGDNLIRVKLLKNFSDVGFNLPFIVHPTAYVSRDAIIEPGCVIFAQAAVNAGSRIGFGSIINTGSTVDHDCFLGEGVHLSPGVHLAGEVNVGDYSWLGIASSVIQRVSIGRDVIVGAGTVVVRDILDDVTVVGVPGRVIKKSD
ncbi:MAG: acetyltransferase [Firmicutes bacterium]|nr:acetyltransferase [Bacillota bacterium]